MANKQGDIAIMRRTPRGERRWRVLCLCPETEDPDNMSANVGANPAKLVRANLSSRDAAAHSRYQACPASSPPPSEASAGAAFSAPAVKP